MSQCKVLDSLKKHQRPVRFSEVFNGYKNKTLQTIQSR